MPTNGQLNSVFGVYRSLCCGEEVVIGVGAEFPDCPHHPLLTTYWKPLVDPEETFRPRLNSSPTKKIPPRKSLNVECKSLFASNGALPGEF